MDKFELKLSREELKALRFALDEVVEMEADMVEDEGWSKAENRKSVREVLTLLDVRDKVARICESQLGWTEEDEVTPPPPERTRKGEAAPTETGTPPPLTEEGRDRAKLWGTVNELGGIIKGLETWGTEHVKNRAMQAEATLRLCDVVETIRRQVEDLQCEAQSTQLALGKKVKELEGRLDAKAITVHDLRVQMRRMGEKFMEMEQLVKIPDRGDWRRLKGLEDSVLEMGQELKAVAEAMRTHAEMGTQH